MRNVSLRTDGAAGWVAASVTAVTASVTADMGAISEALLLFGGRGFERLLGAFSRIARWVFFAQL
jgi:hypothetical protein